MMEISYLNFLKTEFKEFTDPITKNKLTYCTQCYPISHLRQEQRKNLDANSDLEDWQLYEQSVVKDLPALEITQIERVTINDGATHILNQAKEENLVFIVGTPWIGKTSMMRKLTYLMADSGSASLIPLYVELTALASAINSGEIANRMDLIEAWFGFYEEFEAYLRENFFNSRVALILDGLDEIGKHKTTILDWISSLRQIAAIPLCVITSRFSAYTSLENCSYYRMEIFPLKLQINLAQQQLTGKSLDEFIELLIGPTTFFSEFASTPFMMSILVALFLKKSLRDWSSKGVLFVKAINYFHLKPQQMKILDSLACDLMKRGTKEFTELDVSRLGHSSCWNEIKNQIEQQEIHLFIKTEVVSNTVNEISSDDDCPISVDGEEGIGEVRDTPIFERPLFRGNDGSVARSLPSLSAPAEGRGPQASFESVPTNDITSISFILANPIAVYRFKHMRFIEILIARFIFSRIQDSISRISHTVLMESYAFSKTFDTIFPHNFFFNRQYKEIVLILITLFNESMFENFLKYLFNFNTLEHWDLALRVLKERGNLQSYRPFINKLTQIRAKLSVEEFRKGLSHPCGIVRRLVKYECQNQRSMDLASIVVSNAEAVMKSTSWTHLKSLKDWCLEVDDSRLAKSLILKLTDNCATLVNSVRLNSPYSCIMQHLYSELILYIFENKWKPLMTETPQIAVTGPHASPPTFNNTPLNRPEHTGKSSIWEKMSLDSDPTARFSFERMPKSNSTAKEFQERNETLVAKLTHALRDCIVHVPGVNLRQIVKVLCFFNVSGTAIHRALSDRFWNQDDETDKLTLLKILREQGFATAHSIDIILACLSDEDPLISHEAMQLASTINKTKLQAHAITILTNTPNEKFIYALRALGYIDKFKLGERLEDDSFHILAQFIDHKDLMIRYEAINSLNKLLQRVKRNLNRLKRYDDLMQLRDILAVVPHVLKDRIMLGKGPVPNLSISLKCLTSLWTVFDKGFSDTGKWDIKHILVKEHLATSHIVGTYDQIFQIIKRQLTSPTESMRVASWECLIHMEVFTSGEFNTEELQDSIQKAIESEEDVVRRQALKCLYQAPKDAIDINKYLPALANLFTNDNTKVVKMTASILYKWNYIILIREKLSQITSSYPTFSQNDLYVFVRNMWIVIDTFKTLSEQVLAYFVEELEMSKAQEIKQLTKEYRILTNYISDNIHCNGRDSILYSRSQTQYLDVTSNSLDSLSEDQMSSQKNSLESIATEIEAENVSVRLCHFLVKIGIRNTAISQWISRFLKRGDLDIDDYILVAEVWGLLNSNKEYYDFIVEEILMTMFEFNAQKAAQCVIYLNFRSDKIAQRILQGIKSGVILDEVGIQSLKVSIELIDGNTLLELSSSLLYENKDPNISQNTQLRACAVLETIQIFNDTQLSTWIQTLWNGCSLLVQPIWKYMTEQVQENPWYQLSERIQSNLELYQNNWDVRFILRWARTLGLLRSDHIETRRIAMSSRFRI